MRSTLTQILTVAMLTLVFVAYAQAQPAEEKVTYGEKLDPADYGPGIVESMEEVIARDRAMAAGQGVNPKARNGQQGTWVVPSRGATYFPHSGTHNVVNKWGDTRMGIGFAMEVDVHGAQISGQGGQGVWTAGVRAIGYRHGQEVARTDWFGQIGSVPSWFEMDLRGVDRVVIESQPRLNGGGWYAMDDLTFTRKAGAGQSQPATVVLDFEDTIYTQKLTGSGYAGLIWETGTGEFNAAQDVIPAPKSPPVVDEGEPSGAVGGGASRDTGTPPDWIYEFQGVVRGDAGQWSAPPDTCGAIGPNHFVETVNTVFAVYDKQTGALVQQTSLWSLFSGGSGDPRILFDQHSGRWIALDSNFNNRIYLAVSLTDDPTGSWFKANFLASQGSDTGCFPDYPTLGVDAEGIYTGCYMVGCGMTIFAIDKAPLIAPVPSLGTVTAFRGLSGYTIQPVHTYGNAGGEYAISVRNLSTLRLRRVDGPLTAPTLVDLDWVDVPIFSFPPDVPVLGSTTSLDSVDHRLMNAVYRDGSIWTAHAVGGGAGTCSRWYEIDAVSKAVLQSGTVSDPIVNYWMPSIMVNARGDAIMGFSGANANIYAGCYFTGRTVTDAPGEMAPPVQLRMGQAPHNIIDGYGRNRWGDYSLCSVDPVDELTMWTIQEYAHGTNPGNGWSIWGTHVATLRYFYDCNNNTIDDYWDITNGTSPDVNSDGVPDECQAARLYVDLAAGGAGHGLNWANAYTSLAMAMDTAAGGGQVEELWVAAGVYAPDEGTGDRTRSFNLGSGVAIYGGFAGGEISLDQRDPVANVTVLSGDLNNDDGTVGNGENSYHVVLADNADAPALMDGLTIRGGNANGTSTDADGGGVYVIAGAPAFVNCTIEDNAADSGGGLYLQEGDAALTGCTVAGNSAASASGGGGGLYALSGAPTLTDCVFDGNTTGGSGGGVYMLGSAATGTMVNCLFKGNHADVDGGAVYNFYAGLTTLTNITLGSNTAGGSGGGFFTAASNVPALANCVVWGNTDGGGGDESAQVHVGGGSVTVDYSCIQGLTGGLGGTGNLGGDPQFADAELRLGAGSSCIDAGDNNAVPGGVTTDLDGNPRFVDDPATGDTGNPPGGAPFADLGAYEFQAGPAETIVSAASLADHGGSELPVDLWSNNIEPRSDGVVKIEFQVSGPVASVSAVVSCLNNTYTGSVTTTPAGTTVTVEFLPALPDQDSCEITLSGEVDDSFTVRTLKGDIDLNGIVATTDAGIIKPHFGESADAGNAKFDYDTNGTVATTDFGLIKPLFGNTAP